MNCAPSIGSAASGSAHWGELPAPRQVDVASGGAADGCAEVAAWGAGKLSGALLGVERRRLPLSCRKAGAVDGRRRGQSVLRAVLLKVKRGID